MGLTKQYLCYEPSSQFGIIGSTRCNVVSLCMRNTTARYVASAICENVCVWDLKTQDKVMVLQGETSEVSCLAASPDGEHIAVGRTDGTIQIYSIITGEAKITFSGHQSPISALAYDKDGVQLASGSHDTDVVLWDLINESGMYRLNGHKGIITCCYFLRTHKMLITSSKDTFVKWWDLDTKHCFKTMVGHRAEVWNFVLTPDERRLITGSADSELRVWEVEFVEKKADHSSDDHNRVNQDENLDVDENEVEVEDRQVICTKLGSVFRRSQDRVVSLRLTRDGCHLVCHGNTSVLEVFRVYNASEVEEKMKKKLKRAKKRKKKSDETDDVSEVHVERTVDDEIVVAASHSCRGKIASLDVDVTNGGESFHVMTLLRDNRIELVHGKIAPVAGNPSQTTLTLGKHISSGGHRSDSRSADFTSDHRCIVTTGSESAKVWNRSSQQCVHTLPCVRPTCCMVVPGDRHVVVGTDSGKLHLFNLDSGNKLETVTAHTSRVTELALLPNKQGFVSSSEDKSVKFFEFELVRDENSSATAKKLSVTHTRTLQVDEQVLSVQLSSNKKLIAVSLLDCSVKVFYLDTLKFFLSLYGHSLPVNSITISTDSTLIVSGSTDRNVKIWGLDFGDCHKSLFAHDDSVQCVRFVPDTHHFFSCGKDGLIKQWDADSFLLIQVLRGNLKAVWSLSISGDYVLSCGQDRSLRLWERTLEIVIPDEERDREREEQDEKSASKDLHPVVPGESANEAEVGLASKITLESVKSAEKIMESVELYREEYEKEREFKLSAKSSDSNVNKTNYRSKHPILQAYGNISASRFVLNTIKSIKSSELEDSLLVIPFSYVADLLTLLNSFVSQKREVELVCRCCFFLLRIHHGRITSNSVLHDVISELRVNAKKAIQSLRDRAGFNLCALNHVRRELEAHDSVSIFDDVTSKFKDKRKKRRKRDALTRPVLAV